MSRHSRVPKLDIQDETSQALVEEAARKSELVMKSQRTH